jgi:SprT-like family protein
MIDDRLMGDSAVPEVAVRPDRKGQEADSHLAGRRIGRKETVFQQGNAREWCATAPAYGRYWGGGQLRNERQQRIVLLGICPTKVIAQQRLRGIRGMVRGPERWFSKGELARTFREQALQWVADLSAGSESSVKPSTVRDWKRYLDNWLLPILGDLPLAEINHDSLKRLSEEMTGAGLSPKLAVECRAIARSVTASLVSPMGNQIYPYRWSFAGTSEVTAILEEPNGLQTLFAEFNYRYFDGKLPTIPVSWSASELKSGRFGACVQNAQTRERFISIARTLRRFGGVTAMVLLHEMVHLCLNPCPDSDFAGEGHGPEFQCEMLRLATEGAFEEVW